MHPLRKKDAPVAQLVEHLTLNQGVQGSSPCGLVEHLTLNQGVQGSSPCGCTKQGGKRSSFLFEKLIAPVAQLVEHLTLNQGVQGSSPCGCT